MTRRRSTATIKAAAGKASAEIYRRGGDWKRIMRSQLSKSVLYRFAGTPRRRCRFVQRAFSGRPGLPAPVDPEPLIRILADHALEDRLQTGGVCLEIARDPDLGIKAQHELPLLLGPERETRNHGGAGMRGEFGESGSGARRNAEEIHEHP